MPVEKIYQNPTENKEEVIYQLENGMKIIRRDPDEVKKFNLNTWDEINFIPDGFVEIKRQLTPEEAEGINEFITHLRAPNQGSIWERIKKKWHSVFKKSGSK